MNKAWRGKGERCQGDAQEVLAQGKARGRETATHIRELDGDLRVRVGSNPSLRSRRELGRAAPCPLGSLTSSSDRIVMRVRKQFYGSMQSTTGHVEVLLFADDLHGDASRSHKSTSDGSTCKVNKEEVPRKNDW